MLGSGLNLTEPCLGQVPALRSFSVFSWVGLRAATAWGWELAPSMGYVGQGMIMGPRTAFSMLAGAVTGQQRHRPCTLTSPCWLMP